MIEPMERFPDENCALCHRSPDKCICPHCPGCGSQGDAACYRTHFPLLAAPESKGLDLEAAASGLLTKLGWSQSGGVGPYVWTRNDQDFYSLAQALSIEGGK